MGPLDLLGSEGGRGGGAGGGGGETSRQHSETWGKMCVAFSHTCA